MIKIDVMAFDRRSNSETVLGTLEQIPETNGNDCQISKIFTIGGKINLKFEGFTDQSRVSIMATKDGVHWVTFCADAEPYKTTFSFSLDENNMIHVLFS